MGDTRRFDDGPRLASSRRRFLQNATGLAAATAASLAGASAAPALIGGTPHSQPAPGRVPAEDCDCGTESGLPLLAAAQIQGAYVGLANPGPGPRLFALDVGKDQRIVLGAPLAVNLPADFVHSSLSVARGRLVITGGLPFIADSYEVDDELSPDVRAAMDVVPEGLPTSGTRRIDVMGVRPAVFFVDPPSVDALELPELPKRTYAVATSAIETGRGGLMVLIEHSDTMTESYYASAVDVVEELSGQWSRWSIGRQLGESGPNHLAVDGDEVIVGLNTARGARLVSTRRSAPFTSEGPLVPGRILALLQGDNGLTILTRDRGAAQRWSLSSPNGPWADRGTFGLDGEEIVAAIAVAGTRGQSIVLGRRSARLVDQASAVAGRIEGGERHVL